MPDFHQSVLKITGKYFLYSVNTVNHNLDNILNFFINRHTNGNAESFNSKIKLFRTNQRGVVDTQFFLFRLHKFFAYSPLNQSEPGFYSKENLNSLQTDYTQQPVMPKRGRLTRADIERESNKTFRQLRRAHSAVESNINMLEHHGLNRCVDKGITGYRRNVGLSVLAYNLHIIGNYLKLQQKLKEEKSLQDRLRYGRNKARPAA